VQIALSDDHLGAVSCPLSALASGQQMLCEVNGTATAGQHANTASVEGKPPVGPTVSASDSSHYYGVEAGVAIKKLTNGQDASSMPGPYIMEGDPVTWTYIVTNTGNITLTTVTVTDSKGEQVSCDESSLGRDSVMTCTASGTAGSGQYSNTGQVTATPLFGPDVMNSDPSHYFGVTPELQMVKRTNGQIARSTPGPYVVVDDLVTWTYVVTNSGNITLSAITLVDDPLGPVLCPKDVLSVDESMTCETSGVATAGQYTNTATVTGTPTAASAPAAPSARSLASLTRPRTLNRPAGEFACPFDLLTNGQAGSCMMGEQDVDKPPGATPRPATGPPPGNEVSARDTSHYFGADPLIAIQKYTNGLPAAEPPGPIIDFNAGKNVTWTIVVSNSGNVPLEMVMVIDDNGTPGETTDDFKCDFGVMTVDGPAESRFRPISQRGQRLSHSTRWFGADLERGHQPLLRL
jgi:uncharacterized repeat protein (TIGR01451 family)